MEESPRLEILRFLYMNRKLIFMVCLIAGIASILITTALTPKYKSVATVFPPGFNSADRMLENPQFGYNIEADRLIQIGESINLKDTVIERFNLEAYYEIDRSEPDWRSKLLKKYEQDIQFNRTKYMSVEIIVLNKDPEMAAEIANEIIQILSRFWERLFKNNMFESLEYAQKMYFEKQKEVSTMLDSIHRMRTQNADQSLEKMHKQLTEKQSEIEKTLTQLTKLREKGEFYDFTTQQEALTTEVIEVNRIIEIERGKIAALESSSRKNDSMMTSARGRLEGALEHKKYLDKQVADLKSVGKEYEQLSKRLEESMQQYHRIRAEYENMLYSFEPYVESVDLRYMENRYEHERQVLADLKRKYEQAHRYYHQPLPNLFIIDNARPNYKKDSPSFSINLFISIVLAFLAMVVALLFKKRLMELRSSLRDVG